MGVVAALLLALSVVAWVWFIDRVFSSPNPISNSMGVVLTFAVAWIVVAVAIISAIVVKGAFS